MALSGDDAAPDGASAVAVGMLLSDALLFASAPHQNGTTMYCVCGVSCPVYAVSRTHTPHTLMALSGVSGAMAAAADREGRTRRRRTSAHRRRQEDSRFFSLCCWLRFCSYSTWSLADTITRVNSRRNNHMSFDPIIIHYLVIFY
jgi:hypothetical protein